MSANYPRSHSAPSKLGGASLVPITDGVLCFDEVVEFIYQTMWVAEGN